MAAYESFMQGVQEWSVAYGILTLHAREGGSGSATKDSGLGFAQLILGICK